MSRITNRGNPPPSNAGRTADGRTAEIALQQDGQPAARGAGPGRRRLLRGFSRHAHLVPGNTVQLLPGGQAFFPALIAAIDEAAVQIALETYIYADDAVGNAVADALIRAAARGVSVRLVVDGFGAGGMPAALVGRLEAGGVQLRIYRPLRGFRLARRHLRRLHRKIAVIDRRIAFVGGINIIDDLNHGLLAKDTRDTQDTLGPRYDFAVRLTGPLVPQVALTTERLWWRIALRKEMHAIGWAAAAASFPTRTDLPPEPDASPGAYAALLLRDNLRNRRSIERDYLKALGSAREDVILANAYFLPGRKLQRALLACRRRGVRVRLLLQGQVEYRLQHYATHALYATLLDAGIEIHEYADSFLHAKVAVVDETWATVGSSNMDPFSLLLAREANISVYDPVFCRELRTRLEDAIAHRSRQVLPHDHARHSALRRIMHNAAYLLLRLGVVIAGVAGRY